MSDISILISVTGGLAGLIAMLATGAFWLRNRRPSLRLFAPYHYYGKAAGNGRGICNFLLWFTNNSKMPANLFLDTMGISVRRKGQRNFVQVQRLDPAREKPITDFSEAEQFRFGINKVSYFNRFEKMPVTIEKPLLGYICFSLESSDSDSQVSDIRIEIRDQFFKKHSLQINLEKQLNLEPHPTDSRGDKGGG